MKVIALLASQMPCGWNTVGWMLDWNITQYGMGFKSLQL